MKKFGADPKVKKTLVRNYESKAKPTSHKHVNYDVAGTSKPVVEKTRTSQKENELNLPSLCSSEALANYITDVKKSLPALTEESNVDKNQLNNKKVTKKLNFHFNDKMYKNLIELNTTFEDLKSKKDKRPIPVSVKKDLEPNIEDFYQDEEAPDSPPTVPVIKAKFKPIKKVENGELHKLVATFEDL